MRFRHVKQYTIDLSTYYGYGQYGDLTAENLAEDNLSAIKFDQLESMEYISHNYKHRKDQIDYVLQYAEVQRLNITSFAMTYGHMRRLVDSLPKLTEIQLRCRFASDIHRLMNDTRLDTIRVMLLIGEATLDDFAQELLPPHWYRHTVDKQQYLNVITLRRTGLSSI